MNPLHADNREQLKDENQFLKMKLMLEQGAVFGDMDNAQISPELENEFLNNIMAFEQQYAEHRTIKVFDRIGKPQHFKPVKEITDDKIDQAWKELRDFLNENDIDLDACSPNVSSRELYRFTVEELFEQEMDDIDLPGWTTNFIYDEFHPDPVYDNAQLATDECNYYIFGMEPMEWTHRYSDEGIVLNEHHNLSKEQFKTLINQFKAAYDHIELQEIGPAQCSVDGTESIVTGNFQISLTVGKDTEVKQGKWRVELIHQSEWYIKNVQIEGINF